MSSLLKKKYKPSFYNIQIEDVVANTKTGAVIKLKKDDSLLVKELITNGIEEPSSLFDHEYTKKLIQLGMLIDSGADELHDLQTRFNNEKNKEEYSIEWIPGYACNCACPYCSEAEGGNKVINSQDIPTLKKFFKNFISNIPSGKKLIVGLFGGEPFLFTKIVSDVFDYVKSECDKKNITFASSAASNGVLLTEEVVEKFVNDYNFKGVQITIDGCKTTHNQTRSLKNGTPTYDTIISNIKAIIKRNNQSTKKLKLTLRINLLHNTVDDAKSVLEEFTLDELQTINVYFRTIYNTAGYSEENQTKNLDEFYEMAKKYNLKFSSNSMGRQNHYCEADTGGTFYGISPDLTLWKCVNSCDEKHGKIGSISKTGEIVFNEVQIQWQNISPFDDPKCTSCNLLPICWGGCPLNRIKKSVQCLKEVKGEKYALDFFLPKLSYQYKTNQI